LHDHDPSLNNNPASRLIIIKKIGSRLLNTDTRLGQGRIAVKKIFDDNPELADEIKTKITEQLKEKAK
jgi:recombination protein RecA